MHYYLFNIGDYQSHTAHLDDNEDLAYRRMLDWCYLHEKPLPTEIPDVARLIRMRTHSESIANVLREFFKLTESGWWSDRVGREIAAVQMKSEKAKASANARWNANALQSDCDRYAIQDPRPKTQDTIPKIQEKKERAQRGTRLPQDFQLPSDWIEFCNEHRPDLVPREVFAGFKDYWIAQPGQKAVKADWTATWRNWIRRQQATLKTSQERNKTILEGLTRGLIGGGHAKFIE